MDEPILIGGDGGGRNRRLVVLAGAAAVVILALVVLPGLLFGGGGGEGETSFTLPPGIPNPTTTVPGGAPAETFEEFTDKNPFAPLVETGAPAAGTPASTPGGTVPPAVDDTVPAGGGEPGGEPVGTTLTTAPRPPARQPDRVSLLEVFSDAGGQVVASVRVNDTSYQVAEGDEFATSYRVLDLDVRTRCGSFLFGDDRFSLCEGDEVRK